MKKLLKLPELIAALAIVASLVAVTAAAEIPSGKGLAKLLTKPAPALARPAAREGGSCSSRTDVYVKRADFAARAANNRDVEAVHHVCGSCNTTFTALGSGKFKHDVTQHQCSMTSARSCCGNQSGGTRCAIQ